MPFSTSSEADKHRERYPKSQTIIVTGASKGIGLAIAQCLLKDERQHLVVVTGRDDSELKELASQYDDRVLVVLGDITQQKTLEDIVGQSKAHFGDGIDGVVLNHGTMGSAKRIADADPEDWDKTYSINLTSCVGMLKLLIPSLRQSKGRVILTSSGAAEGAYSAWGAYGATKAAMNHLAKTMKVEEPLITTVSIRPGVVDTNMQRDIREIHLSHMDPKDQEKFTTAKTSGSLLPPSAPGNVMARLVLDAKPELSGLFLSWNDSTLGEFQDK